MKTREEIEALATKKYPEWSGALKIGNYEQRVAFIEGYEQAQNESQWISVDERLPDNHDDVLVIGDGWDGMNWWRIYFFENGTWFTVDGEEVDKESQLKITHWMPLPPKPTK